MGKKRQVSGGQGLGEGERVDLHEGMKELFGGDGALCILHVIVL